MSYTITVTKHELSEESNCVVLHFGVTTVRPTDDRKVKAGGFMLFVEKGIESQFAVGSEYVLVDKNDIIEEESEDVSSDSDTGGETGSSVDDRTI